MTFDGLHIMLTLLAIGLLVLVVASIGVRRRMEAALKGELFFAQERIRSVERQRDAARDHSAQLARELQLVRAPLPAAGAPARIVPVGTAPLLTPQEATSSNRPAAVAPVHHDSGIMQGALLGAVTAASFHRLYANSDSISVASETSSNSSSSSSSD